MSEYKISCPHCSQRITLDSAWAGQTLNCPACQTAFTVPQLDPVAQIPAAIASVPATSGLRISKPSAEPPQIAPAPSRPGAIPGLQPSSPVSRTSGLAIASLVLSVLGCAFLTAIAGVICGHLARRRIRSDASLSGNGLALAGLIIGYLMIALGVGGGVKFALDVKNRVDEITAQRAGELSPSSARTTRAPNGPVGARVRSVIPVPADAVSGTIKGEPFKYTRSSMFQGTGSLDIDGREFTTEGLLVTLFLTKKPGETLENRTWHITPTTAPGAAPSVFIIRLHAGSSTKDTIVSGYEMDLTTGQISGGAQTQIGNVSKTVGGRISGTIKLKVNGAVPVDIKGNFTATFD